MISSAPFVDLLHDLLSPLNACGDQLVRAWASLWPSEQIVSRLHVQAGKDRSHQSDHTFAALVHGHESSMFAISSLYFRCSQNWVFQPRVKMLIWRIQTSQTFDEGDRHL